MLDPATLEWKFYTAPHFEKTKEPPGAYGIAVAGDGSVWYAQNEADQMARLDVNTGKVEEFKIPYDGYSMPRRLQSDANGDIWVALWQAGKLMKVDHKTRKMTIYDPPTPNNGAYVVAIDKKQGGSPYVWFSEHKVDRIARFDPRNGQFVEFPLPYAESDARRVEIDPTNPNRIFFSGNTADRIGFIEYLP
jgi:streptogramin lyase